MKQNRVICHASPLANKNETRLIERLLTSLISLVVRIPRAAVSTRAAYRVFSGPTAQHRRGDSNVNRATNAKPNKQATTPSAKPNLSIGLPLFTSSCRRCALLCSRWLRAVQYRRSIFVRLLLTAKVASAGHSSASHHPTMANDICVRRLTKELRALSKDETMTNPRIVVAPNETNILERE